MEMKLGSNIVALRRKKGLTQEQLADMLGVTAAAVSKWETGNSCPDILLLCPLARALDTSVDGLLSFEQTLSGEEALEKLNAVVETAQKQGLPAAEAALWALLRQYPNCVALKCGAVTALDLLDMLYPDMDPARRSERTAQKRALMEDVRASGDGAHWQSAVSALAAYAVSKGELDRAEALLDELPQQAEDATPMRVRLYLARGQREKAMEALQKRLYVLIHHVQLCMSFLMSAEVESNADRALQVGAAYRQVAALFGVGEATACGLMAERYRQCDMPREALAQMSEFVQRITGSAELPSRLLFSTLIQPQGQMPAATREAQALLLRELEEDPFWQQFRGAALYEGALTQLRESVAPEGQAERA